MARRPALALAIAALGSACATATPLHRAVERGDVAEVNRLLDSGAKVDARDAREDLTPLGWAAARGNVEIVRALLARGADPNARNAGGFTPLHGAADFDRTETVALLLSKGADVSARTADGETPLHRAIARLGPLRRSPEIAPAAEREAMTATVRLLLERGADPDAAARSGATPLLYAASTGDAPLVAMLADRGAALEARGPDGVTPLYVAAVSGDADVAAELIARGAKVDAATKSGYTPLSYAARSGAARVASLLVEKGADVNAKDVEGNTPLLRALSTACEASPGGERALAAAGASPAALADLRRRLASVEGRWREVAALLIAHGADVRVHADAPRSPAPLLLACNLGDPQLVQALLDRGAELDDLSTGETPLHAAIAEDHPGIAALLLAKGARVDLRNVSGRTALHFAAAFLDDPSLAEAMLARGADPNARDARGRTPLSYADAAKHARTAAVLRAHGAR